MITLHHNNTTTGTRSNHTLEGILMKHVARYIFVYIYISVVVVLVPVRGTRTHAVVSRKKLSIKIRLKSGVLVSQNREGARARS